MSTPPSATPLAIVGRQPIFDRKLRVYGYELLFRSDAGSQQALVSEGTGATARVVVNSFVEIGLENIVGSTLAFVNVNRDFLLSEFIRSLPKDRVVLEVLEDIRPDAKVLETLRALAAEGYCLAFDDFIYRDELVPFLEVASIVKLDISQLDHDALETHVKRLKSRSVKLVAERVETVAEMEACRADGFDLFQGHFLARPVTLQRNRAPDGDRLAALRTLAALNSAKTTIEELEGAVSRDVTLSYRLLRVINSAGCGLAGRVESLRQAIVYLGRDRVRNWVTLLVLSGQNAKPAELLTTGLVRARMCEQLAGLLNPEKADVYFTAGLFSILDAVIDMPMEQLVEALSLAPEISCALTERRGPIGDVLGACIAHECAQWTDAECVGLTPEEIGAAYLDSIRWSRSVCEALVA